MANKKGIGAIAFVILFGVAVVIMAFLFLVFFKLHITLFTSDQLNINSYSTFLSTMLPLNLPEENFEMAFVINRNNNFAGYDYNFGRDSFLGKVVKDALPESCYRFEIKTDKSKIIFEDKGGFVGGILSGFGITVPGFTCDESKMKFRSIMPMPVLKDGQPAAVNAELLIYGVKEFKFSSPTDLVKSLTSSSAWPLVVRK